MKKIITKNTIVLFIGVSVYYIVNQFIIKKQLDISVLISLLIVVGLFTYNELVKLKTRNSKAFNGVSMLNNGDAFIFDNMIIRKDEGKYTIQYQINWNNENTDNKNKNDDYLKELKSDYNSLISSNVKLKDYLKDSLIEYSIVDNICKK